MPRHLWNATLGALTAVLVGCTFAAVPESAPEALDRSAFQTRESAGQDLLYLSGYANSVAALYLYTYPQGLHVKTITGYPLIALRGECADASGHVYVVNASGSNSQVLIYRHGGTSPMRTLNVQASEAFDCSVDRVTGNLAVFGLPKLLIYGNAKGSPREYPILPNTIPVGCDYDDKGDLFVEGVSVHKKMANPGALL